MELVRVDATRPNLRIILNHEDERGAARLAAHRRAFAWCCQSRTRACRLWACVRSPGDFHRIAPLMPSDAPGLPSSPSKISTASASEVQLAHGLKRVRQHGQIGSASSRGRALLETKTVVSRAIEGCCRPSATAALAAAAAWRWLPPPLLLPRRSPLPLSLLPSHCVRASARRAASANLERKTHSCHR